MQKEIVLSTDAHFMMPAETLIKSIACYNRDIRIDVINADLPQEWFQHLNDELANLNIQVISVKYDPDVLKDVVVSTKGLTQMTYGRFLIPELIKASRVLYLDVDMIVKGNIDELFELPLNGHPFGAVLTEFEVENFNAGVLLMDNDQLRKIDFTSQMLEKGQVGHAKDDQTILNEEFHDNFEQLPGKYNVQIGGDLAVVYNHRYDHYDERLAASQPFTIIHYTGYNKPWLLLSPTRFRKDWWFYRNLDYGQVRGINGLQVVEHHQKIRPVFLIYTNSQDLEHLPELLAAFPQCDFHVIAYSVFGPKIEQLLSYPNLHLHEQTNKYITDDLCTQADLYLDINQTKDQYSLDFVDRMLKRGVPVVSFDNIPQYRENMGVDFHMFAAADLNGAIDFITELVHEK